MKRDGCIHCGTPLRGNQVAEGFCCSGCEQVYRLIQEDGLETFYTLQDQMGRPVNKRFKTENVNKSSLRRVQEAVEAGGDSGVARLRISGMTCLGCVWLIEQISRRVSGCRSARANLQDRVLDIRWEKGQFDLVELASELDRFNYRLAPLTRRASQVSDIAWRALISGILAFNALWLEKFLEASSLDPSLTGLFQMLALSVVVMSLFIGSGFFVAPVLRALWMRVLHYDMLNALAVVLLTLDLFLERTIFQNDSTSWGLLPWVFFFLSAGRWLQQGFCKRLVDQFFRDAVICERSAVRWRRLLNTHSICIVLVCWVLVFVELRTGTSTGILKIVAGFLLLPALYPLTVVTRYGWPQVWIFAGILSHWLALVGSFYLSGSPLIAALWSALSGFLWLVLFSLFGHCPKSEQVS